ncbi:MAG: hypothetical protein HND44_07635 [Chloroflexi bacterium]|nr:hypothetical protein [Ardenticatenaceae bacterium]MBL1128359.1 hypothetical protein [Chloroflexota bacterium]NOG34434.1 hypothetical protein [Chloroflexota bacterium]GIK57677.1 MAG: hypothetical protein BroJett015_33400 [Chloroflexota bacterium]
MSEKHQFSPLERAPYMAYFGDGLWDVWLGLFLLAMGFGFLSKEFTMLVILLALTAPFMWEAKWRITVPRLAPMRYSAAQFMAEERRKGILLTVFSAVLFVGILLFIAASYRPQLAAWFAQFNGYPLGILMSLEVGLVGYLYRALNWAVYAFLLMALTFASAWFGLVFVGCILLAGVLILVSGLGLLLHFWQEHVPLAFS